MWSFIAKLKKMFAVIGFVVLVAVGYLTVNVQTSCPAEAAACACSLCVYGNGMPNALNNIWSGTISPGINYATVQVELYYSIALNGFRAASGAAIESAQANLIDWFETFWYYNLLGAMQAQTEQLTVSDLDQTRIIGSFADVREANRTSREIALQEIQTHREQRPSENACVGATMVGGLTRANVIGNAYNTASVAERLPRGSNAVGTAAARGVAADQKSQWDNYTANYCDPNLNSGAAGCATAGALAGRDVNVTGEIFKKDTIDVRDPDTKKVIDDMAVTLIEPQALDPINPAALSSPQGQEQMLETLSYRTRRQAAYDAYYHVVSKRVPGTNMGSFVRDIRDSAGIDPSVTADQPGRPYNPSQNEVMEVIMSERYKTGQYAIQQIDEPESNQAELVMQQAFQAMRTNDILELMDRYAIVLAAQVGPEVTNAHNFSDRSESRRTR